MRARIVALLLLALAGCDAPAERRAVGGGSTIARTFGDPDSDGRLEARPGEPLIPRTGLAPAARRVRVLASFAQLTDAHVRDEESPARLPFLDRLGSPFDSSFRPQEALAPHVLAAAVAAVNAARPGAVIVTGDLADSAQRDELDQALAVLRGGRVRPDTGAPGYRGPQERSDPDPFYYRPDVDPPLRPGILDRAQRPFGSPGLTAPWFPVVGNHDLLVAGEVAPGVRTRRAATGDRAVWEPPSGDTLRGEGVEPLVRRLLDGGAGRGAERVPADSGRRHLAATEVLGALRSASGHGGTGTRLDYAFDLAPRVRGIVLDLVRRGGGSDGELVAGQLAWLESELARAGSRRVLVFSHQPLDRAAGGRRALELLARNGRVVAAIAGHTHRNSIRPFRTARGGLWLVTTASLADWPQQARMFRLAQTAGGGVVLDTWMLDADARDALAVSARELSFLDAQGGRPRGFAGEPADRNARLYLRTR